MTSGDIGFGIDLGDFVSHLNFDQKAVKKRLKEAVKPVRSSAQRLVGKKRPTGNYPAKKSGHLRRSITIHTPQRKKDALWVKVQQDVPQNGQMFYPAPLVYGVKSKDPQKKWCISPRDNWVVDAGKLRPEIENAFFQALEEAVKGWSK